MQSKRALQTHLAMVHAKKNVHYQRRRIPASPGGMSSPINVEELIRAGCGSDEKKAWLRGMKRVWRLPRTGHSDLIFVEPVTRKSPRAEALYQICLRIMQRGLESALTAAPKRMRRVKDYVRQHLNVVRKVQDQQRYVRLRTPEARAKLLALGLGSPEVCLTYAERSEAKSREFRKKERATHYRSKK